MDAKSLPLLCLGSKMNSNSCNKIACIIKIWMKSISYPYEVLGLGGENCQFQHYESNV
jgi:hypothetical protein